MKLTKKNIQIQNGYSFYPSLEIMLDDVVYAEGKFVDRESRNEATFKIQSERITEVRNQILQNQEDAEKWRKIANHKHFARYKKCQICHDVMSKPIDGNGSVGVKGGLLCTICWECEGLRERLKKRLEECEDKSDFESVGEVEFTYRLENELQKILREGFSEEVKKSSLRIKHEKIDKEDIYLTKKDEESIKQFKNSLEKGVKTIKFKNLEEVLDGDKK